MAAARRLGADPEVTNRLIEQGLYFLGIGEGKEAFDRNWWSAKNDWTTPAGVLLEKFIATLPRERTFRLTLFGSAPLQLTLDRQLLSADVDLFSEDDEDLAALIRD